MTVEDINKVREDFKKAAQRADKAGFDIIENGNIINFKGKTKLVLK